MGQGGVPFRALVTLLWEFSGFRAWGLEASGFGGLGFR